MPVFGYQEMDFRQGFEQRWVKVVFDGNPNNIMGMLENLTSNIVPSSMWAFISCPGSRRTR